MTTPDVPTHWTLPAFFEALAGLGSLRVISRCGPSTFEAICEVGPFGVAHGHLNAITERYHWHLELARCRWLRSADEVHARSGRQVLFFQLAESAESAPFLAIYLYRGKGEEFEPQRLERFASLHRELAAGRQLELPS